MCPLDNGECAKPVADGTGGINRINRLRFHGTPWEAG